MAVLAYYSIRSKQAYIFRTNYLREITGGSKLISEAFEVLFHEAAKTGLKVQRAEFDQFSVKALCRAFADGSVQMAEVFQGGGNATVLFDSRDSFRLANAAFTSGLIRDCPGMTPVCAGIDVDLSDGSDYKADWKRLQEAAGLEKARMLPYGISELMPFSLQDHNTLQSVETRMQGRDVSAEAAAKLWAGLERGNDLDRMVTEKGVESLLAIVHADGNRMGEKISCLLENASDYDTCIRLLRDFSRRTEDVFYGNSREKMEKLVQGHLLRWLIHDGDDITFICNARDALRLTRAYLHAVEETGEYSSCAGICIFHSHYPCYMAYSMAEEACESAKKTLRESCSGQGSLVDFHYIHSGIGRDLDSIRESQGTAQLIARPFRLHRETPGSRLTLEDLDSLAETVRRVRISRSNIKRFGSSLEISRQKAHAELTRITARSPELKELLENISDDETIRDGLLYDFSEIFDLWYSDTTGKEGTSCAGL